MYQTRRRILSMLLVAAMLLALLPAQALAAPEDEVAQVTPEEEILSPVETNEESTPANEIVLPPAEEDSVLSSHGKIFLVPVEESVTGGGPRRSPALRANAGLATYPASGEYYGDQITDANARTVYRALVNGIETIAAKGDVSVNITGNDNALSTSVAIAVSAFDRDYPEVFWTAGYSAIGSSGRITGVSFAERTARVEYKATGNAEPAFWYNQNIGISTSWRTGNRDIAADRNTLTSVVSSRAEEARSAGSTDYEQLKYIHDWLTKNNSYNQPAAHNATPPSEIPYSQTDSTPWTPISALDSSLSPVCEGYARAFKLVCDELNIPCILVSSDGHMWNYVQADVDGDGQKDGWYGVDVTFDDPTVNGSDTTGTWTYFLTNTWVNDTDHTESQAGCIGDSGNVYFYPTLATDACPVPATALAFTDNVEAPAKGGTPDTSAAVTATYAKIGDAAEATTSAFSATVAWYTDAACTQAHAGPFAGSTAYTAKVTLTAEEGKCFHKSMTAPDEWTVDVSGSGSTATLTKTFPATAAKAINSLTVTTQPSKNTYTHGDTFDTSGMVVTAAYDDNTTEANFTGYTVEYATAGKNYLKSGDTKVTLNVGSVSADVTVTVSAKVLTVTGLTAVNRAYDGTTTVNLTGGTLNGVVSGEDVSATMPTTGTISDANAGNGKAVTISTISLSGTDAGNYTLTQPTTTVNISAKPLAANMITLGTQATYNGSEQNVVITSVSDGSNLLAVGTDYTITSGGTATDVGNTTLTITGKGNFTGSATAAWSLQKATPTTSDFSITVPDVAGVPYTDSPISVAAPTTAKNGMGAITVKYGGGTDAPTNAGTYAVTFDVAEGTNYTAAAGLSIGTLTINKIDYSGTTEQAVTVRSGQAAENQKLTLPALPAGASYGAVTVATSNGLITPTPTVSGTELTYSVASKDNGTTETVTIAVTGATNYNNYTLTLTFTAREKEDANVTFSGAVPATKSVEDPAFSLTANAANPGTGASAWTWTSSDPTVLEVAGSGNTATVTIKKVGIATITAKFESDTHMGSATTGTITVTKAPARVAAPPTGKAGLAYTGAAQELVNAGTAAGGEMQYAVDDGGYAATIPTGTAAKTYTVKYKVVGDANHADTAEQTISVVIDKAAPDVGTVSKSSSATIYPHTVLNTITLAKTGSAAGVLALTAGQVLTVGTKEYDWTFTPTDAGNYKTATGKISLTVVEDALASIAVTAPTKTAYQYGERLNTAGAVVTATYESGATKDVTAEAAFAPTELKTVGTQTITVTYGGRSANFYVTVDKAAAVTLTDVPVGLKFDVTDEQSVALGTAGMPADAGALTYTKGAESKTGSVTVSSWSVDSTGTVKYTLTGGANEDTVTLPVTIGSANYADSTVNVQITLTDKNVPAVTVQDITRTYNGEAVADAEIQGTATFGGNPVEGVWTWKGAPALTAVADSGTKTVVFTPADVSTYAVVETNLTLTINKATPAGTPAYTAINAAGMTLADAALATGTITPAGGTIAWDDGDSTAVSANTAYNWTYTPADTANYNVLTGTLTPYVYVPARDLALSVDDIRVDYSGTPLTSASISGSAVCDGIAVAGSWSWVTSPASMVNANESGYVATVEFMPADTGRYTPARATIRVYVMMLTPSVVPTYNSFSYGGQTLASANLQCTASVSGSIAWDLPESTVLENLVAYRWTFTPNDPVNYHTVSGTVVLYEYVPSGGGGGGWTAPVTPVVPSAPAAPGQSNANQSRPGQDASQPGGDSGTPDAPDMPSVPDRPASPEAPAVIELVPAAIENLADVAPTDWYAGAVSQVISRGLFNGTSATQFSPNSTMTRSMLVTVLWRLEGMPASSGNSFSDVASGKWYSEAVNWASSNGVVNGLGNGIFGVSDSITREQLATIMYRYAQQKGLVSGSSAELSGYADAGSVSSYAREAMAWAVSVGLISGTGNGTLEPGGNATRAQVATIIVRYAEKFAA